MRRLSSCVDGYLMAYPEMGQRHDLCRCDSFGYCSRVRQASSELGVRTSGQGLHEITREVADWVGSTSIHQGLLTLFIRHTSASLVIQENADPDVRRDLEDYMLRLVPEEMSSYRHTIEGPDDMPAHIRSALTSTQLSIPVAGSRLALGTWQGIYVFEHRHAGSIRAVALHLIGD